MERSGLETAAASFIEAGLRFFETLAAGHWAGGSGAAHAIRLNQPLAELFTRDARTNRPVLSIPLPESVTQGRISGAIFALLTILDEPRRPPAILITDSVHRQYHIFGISNF